MVYLKDSMTSQLLHFWKKLAIFHSSPLQSGPSKPFESRGEILVYRPSFSGQKWSVGTRAKKWRFIIKNFETVDGTKWSGYRNWSPLIPIHIFEMFIQKTILDFWLYWEKWISSIVCFSLEISKLELLGNAFNKYLIRLFLERMILTPLFDRVYICKPKPVIYPSLILVYLTNIASCAALFSTNFRTNGILCVCRTIHNGSPVPYWIKCIFIARHKSYLKTDPVFKKTPHSSISFLTATKKKST